MALKFKNFFGVLKFNLNKRIADKNYSPIRFFFVHLRILFNLKHKENRNG